MLSNVPQMAAHRICLFLFFSAALAFIRPTFANSPFDPEIDLSEHLREKLSPRALDLIKNRTYPELLVILKPKGNPQDLTGQSSPIDRRQNLDAQRLSLKRDLTEFMDRFTDNEISIKKQFNHLPVLKFALNDKRVLEQILALGEIVAVVEEQQFFPNTTESLPLISQPEAMSGDIRGKGQSFGIVDTGIDYTKAVFGNCSAPGIPSGCRVAASIDIAEEDGALDDSGHGTLVSGIAAQMAPDANIVGLDVFSGGSASTTDLLAAIDWLVTNRETYNITAANFSLGTSQLYSSPCDSRFNPFKAALDTLLENDILPVVASGNEGSPNSLSNPACVSAALSVGAVYDANVGTRTWSACSDASTNQDQVACFSNSASFLDLLAPGAMITSAGYQGGGTSMAAPHVTAATALLSERFSDATMLEIQSRLLQSSKWIVDAKNNLSHPRLDLESAMIPENDLFAASLMLTDLSFSDNSAFSSVELGEPGSFSSSIWYQYSPSEQSKVNLLLDSGHALTLNIYEGNPDQLDSLVLVATISSHTPHYFEFAEGQTYLFQIAGTGAGGPFAVSSMSVTTYDYDEDIPFLPIWAYSLFALIIASGIRYSNS